MKVDKLKKHTKGFYNVSFDNGESVLIHEDLVLRENLLIKNDITEDMLEDIKVKNDFEVNYYKLINYISYKMRSTEEIKNYCFKKNILPSEAELLINRLLKDNYLNDELFAIAFAKDKFKLYNNGPEKIKQLLKKNKINEQIIKKAIDSILILDIEEKLEKLISNYLKTNQKNSISERKKKTIARFITKGYDLKMIKEILNSIDIPEDLELIKVEILKIKMKLELKFSEPELTYKLKENLYAKGYKLEDYKEFI